MKILVKNKRAYFDYEFSKNWDAGIVLLGHEVKTIKAMQVSLQDAIAHLQGQELWLKGMNVSLYPKTAQVVASNYDVRRPRKLLLKSVEIGKIAGFLDKPGYVLVPTQIFLNNRGLIKVKLEVGKLKRKIEKKQILKEKDTARQMQREVREYR